MTIHTMPGCVNEFGTQMLVDSERFTEYIRSQQELEDIIDEVPGDSSYKRIYNGQVVRLSGVMLVDRSGRDRPCIDVYNDMVNRIEYLKRRNAPEICITELERYINVMRLAGDIDE